ncbi:MAG: HAD-IIB family hydrolase [Atopobiaceae bacterium]|jgi:Cof subfamily protein (haloacid dehalogenase superfamily)|uniref:HAD-IIB family hydrolase n=1 Tax=Paratractidigestivibacter sp. TaxID=2847316 RepID=UPI000D79364E|nr:HAD-IIB family hydrolase [Atopobiaceae bacterium]PWM29768.1 MAG: HAD family phosphatase [Coriobacteriia bacterium]
MPNPVVAFFDVDGTLTYRDPVTGPTDAPRPRVVDAIRRFVGAGNVAAVCTGRSVLGITNLMASCPFAGAVTLDGTHVVYGKKVVYDRTIDRDVFARTVAEMHRIGMEALIEGTYGCALVYGDAEASDLRRAIPGAQTIEQYEAAGGRMDFGKIDFIDTSLAACRSSEFLMGSYHYMNVGGGYHELAIPGTSKGIGGRAFIDALPFRPSRVYAFGDSENDLAILDEADVAVVMGNAHDNVKEHADYVTDTAAEDGVATALEHFGLI